MMKKLFPYILIVLIVVQLLAPFTVGVGIKNNLEVKSNKAEAADITVYYWITTRNADGFLQTSPDRDTTITACETKRTVAKAGLEALGYTVGSCEAHTTLLSTTVPNLEDSNLSCTFPIGFKLGPCIAQGLYWLFFKPTSALFALAGRIMDITLNYSLQDTSYRSEFVVQGWGIVRDFCNMFFIFVLLYIAFGTILNLHGGKTKEMIINVVIIGLLINFSLFTTQVIIDASNILARVFYNPQTIITGTAKKDANGNPLPVVSELGDLGEIKLSEAIVSKVDPHKIVLNSASISEIPTKNIEGGDEPTTTGKGMSVGTFILIIFITTAVNIVGMIVFLSCAFIFVGRVVMLWLAMILAPLAFFSYTVPALSKMKMIGWENWWKDTLSMAFLAPIFAFFMYIIVGFMDKGLKIINVSLESKAVGLSSVVAVIVPFIFIVVLLLQAKKIAVSMSGDVGAALSKAGAAVGGAVTGGLIGAGAMAMRGTVGRLGNKLATSKWASTHGAVGRTFGNLGKWTGSKSFDARATKLGVAAGKGMDVDMGKAKEGGYAKHLSDKVEKRQKRAKDLEVHENEDLKQKLNAVERNLQELLRTNSHELEILDKMIKITRENATDLASKARLDPTGAATDPITGATTTNKLAAISAANKLADLKGKKKARKDAGTFTDSTGMIHNFTLNTTTGTATGRSINNLEDIDIPDAHAEIEKENRDRKWAYAEAKTKWGGRANKEAAHKIRMEAKLDSGTKT